MIKYVVAIAILGAVLFAVDRNGYNRCKSKQKEGVSTQKVDDAKAVTEIKEKAHAREKERIKYVKVIQKIKDPSGCATTPVPNDRANGVREFYRSQARQ